MTPSKKELDRFWKLLQFSISSDFIFTYFKDEKLDRFHDYSKKKLYDLERSLEEEFRNKFVKDK